jgi:hypothetical protein
MIIEIKEYEKTVKNKFTVITLMGKERKKEKKSNACSPFITLEVMSNLQIRLILR